MLSEGKADRLPLQLADQDVFACPTQYALEDVLNNGIHRQPGEHVCSIFDGAAIETVTEFNETDLSLGGWNSVKGTYSADFLLLKIDGARLYAVLPFDVDEHLLRMEMYHNVVYSPVIGTGFVPGVSYERWDAPPGILVQLEQ